MPENEQESKLSVLVELVDKVTEPLHDLSEKFEEFESGIFDVGKAFGSAFLGYELFEHLTEPAAEFQEEQVRLALATRASAEQLKAMKEQAEELSVTYPSSIEKVTAAQTELYQTFRNFDQMREGTEIADKLATVMRIDATESTRILASAYENLEDRTKPVNEGFTEIADKLTLLSTRFPSGASGASRMARDFARLGAAAKTYGIDVNQLFALLGELNRLHVAGQMGAGMFAQQLIHLLGAVDEKGVNALSRYGLQVVHTTEGHLNLLATLERMSKMSPKALEELGKHLPGQGQALMLLVDHMQDLTQAYGEFKDSAGVTAIAVAAQSATYQNQMTLFQNSLTNLKEQLGILALPEMTQLVTNMHNLIVEVTKLGEEHPKLTKFVADLAMLAAAGITLVGAVGFIGKLIGFGLKFTGVAAGATAAWTMLTNAIGLGAIVAEEGIAALGPALALAFESNPIGWIVTALAAIAFLSYEIWKNWEGIKNTWESLTNLGLGGIVKTVLPNLSGGASGAASSIGALAGQVVHIHYMEGATITTDADHADSLKSMLHGHSDELGQIVHDIMHGGDRTSFLDPAGAR